MKIENVYEKERGCGFRKPGFYLRSDDPGAHCGVLPITLDVCDCCGSGIKPSRGMTYIKARLIQGECSRPLNGGNLTESLKCNLCEYNYCAPDTPMGLIWIGTRHYPTPQAFIDEAKEMGISRRLPALPRSFEIGMWVMLAHRNAKPIEGELDHKGRQKYEKQIFYAFKPNRIEYVVGPNDSEKKLKKLVDKGVKLVNVIPLYRGAEAPSI